MSLQAYINVKCKYGARRLSQRIEKRHWRKPAQSLIDISITRKKGCARWLMELDAFTGSGVEGIFTSGNELCPIGQGGCKATQFESSVVE